MTLANTAITVYSTWAEFCAAYDRDAVTGPCVLCYPQPYVEAWQCAGCKGWLPPETWRFYPRAASYAHCPHCAEGVAL